MSADFNVEYRDPGDGWSAQHTQVTQSAAHDLAKALWKHTRSDGKHWPIRITQGQPFGTVVADFNRMGSLRWIPHRINR